MKTVFISGNFLVLHPGHIRLFHIAKGLGQKLIVGINSDEDVISSMKVPLELRIESLKSVVMVDEIIVINSNLEDILLKLKPDFVLKGKEHAHSQNVEESIIKDFGGRLVFGSGEFAMTSEEFLMDSLPKSSRSNRDLVASFFKRHQIKQDRIINLLERIKRLNLLVIGDLLIDEYIDCESIGLSQEDPIVVFRPTSEKKFVGGAGIVALHSASIGVSTHFLTYVGDDSEANFARTVLDAKNLSSHLIMDGLKRTIVKKRFRSGGKTEFRLTINEDSAFSTKSRFAFQEKAIEMLENMDILIFSDFNYGLLDNETVRKLIEIAKQKKIFVSADCQISSQIANYLKYNGVDLVTPTEHEVRVTLRDNHSGLAKIAIEFQELLKVSRLFITLGKDGLLFQESSDNKISPFRTDMIPAFSSMSVDSAGAGDSMLVFASLALAVGATTAESAYLGSLAAGIQVSRVGNIPLTITELIEAIKL